MLREADKRMANSLPANLVERVRKSAAWKNNSPPLHLLDFKQICCNIKQSSGIVKQPERNVKQRLDNLKQA
jgi:hypothetical protein